MMLWAKASLLALHVILSQMIARTVTEQMD